jgi:hypothetical protein
LVSARKSVAVQPPGAGNTGDGSAGRPATGCTRTANERLITLTAGVFYRGVDAVRVVRVVELGGSLRDGGCGVGAAARSSEAGRSCRKTGRRGEFTDDGTHGDSDGCASDDACQPRVGPLAIARAIAPINTPKASVNDTMTAAGACVASVMARVEKSRPTLLEQDRRWRSHVDRWWRSSSSRHSRHRAKSAIGQFVGRHETQTSPGFIPA